MATVVNLFSKWKLPPERDFGWKMKSLESAQTSFVIDSDGRFKLSIEHDVIRGVTPTMLLWWFRNIGGEITYNGKVYPRYLVWHPKDHIHWSLEKRSASEYIGAGDYFKIVEALGRNMKFLVASTECVEKLDDTGIRLVKRIGTIEIFSLQHDFVQVGSNTKYTSQMIVGTSKKPFSKIINPCIKLFFFTKEMAVVWLKHNVEEVGNFEFFLPELYKKEVRF